MVGNMMVLEYNARSKFDELLWAVEALDSVKVSARRFGSCWICADIGIGNDLVCLPQGTCCSWARSTVHKTTAAKSNLGWAKTGSDWDHCHSSVSCDSL